MDEQGYFETLSNGDPLVSVMTEIGPGWDLRFGAMLGIFLQQEEW